MCKITFSLCAPFMGLSRVQEIIDLSKRLGANELQYEVCSHLVSKLCSGETSGPCGPALAPRGECAVTHAGLAGTGTWPSLLATRCLSPSPCGPPSQLAEGQQKASSRTHMNLCLPVFP